MKHAGPFGQVPTAAIFDSRLHPGDVRVLAALCSYADEEGMCFPAIRTVAERLNMKRQSVQPHLATLRDAGWLEIVPRRRADGGYTTHEYRIVFQRPLRATPPMQAEPASHAVPAGHPHAVPAGHAYEHTSNEHTTDPDPKFVTKRESITVKDARSLSLFNDLWDAAKDVIGAEPTTEGERRYWSDFIKVLLAAGATPEEFRRRAARYIAVYERKRLTIKALANHWSQFSTEAPNDGESTRKHADVEAARQAEHDRLAAIKRDLYRDWKP